MSALKGLLVAALSLIRFRSINISPVSSAWLRYYDESTPKHDLRE